MKGGFISIRHNEVRDSFGQLLDDVCHDVSTEPTLQPLTRETLSGRSFIREDEARLDIVASGVWGGRFEKNFSDVHVFNPNSPTYQSLSLESCYPQHEQEKRRKYEQRITRIEHASFTSICSILYWRNK